jgi:ubiquinone/menaquinone biosynthesis C-methylase UbiE
VSVALMQYLPGENEAGARKYLGDVATGYDKKREDSDKWKIEQRIVEDMLSDLPAGSSVLDCPCGTGRFFKFYHDKGFQILGADLSADMLQVATTKVVDPMMAQFAQCDVRQLPIDDKAVDAAVMVRLTRWLSPEDCQQALRELQRVAKQKIVFTARVANHQAARPIELFEAVLDGWKISRNEAGYAPEYRIVELTPA